DKFFMVEITPIIHKKSHLGTIIMLTDITEHKENMRIIKAQQQQIIEKERLASLGTLMGGISHNLKTPIMSISGCITALEDLSNEYHESVGNPIVTENDHYGIANEIQNNLSDLKSHISYISNALTAMKNQVINPDARKEASFTLEELILNIEFLMKYEVKLNLCTLSIEFDKEVKKDDLINGDIGTLVQIINNLISNSIQSYDSAKSTHETEISKRKVEIIVKKNGNYIIFEIKDYGKGISYEIKDKLFKEMVTTKGKAGSGIGLYLSYSKVRLMFNGDMWFESEEGFGTSFYVKVKAQ
ncbi:MAG TPA: HAMP domain-containing sensor histidine kinase, partial [Clostridia bacterium]